ncbi:hypothetical protein ALP07_200000 [Pseudomonas savastanoi pv. glycinea]|nr:hypothetical protein ALP07_200000 [Pseudomonas savastanoi pv. glycinea]
MGWIGSIDQPQHACPAHHLIHLGKEALASSYLRLPACSKSVKLIWLIGSSDQVVRRFSHTRDLFGESQRKPGFSKLLRPAKDLILVTAP